MADIVDLLNKLKQDVANNIRVCMPAKIESYDYKNQKASVKISMQELYEDGTVIDYPIVSGVPVVFMAAGGASINLPVLKGDSCFVIFFDRDMSNWLLGGADQKPNSTRMHNMSDAVALMGLNPFNSVSKAENNTDVIINYSGSKILMKPDGIINVETTKDINIISAETINMNSKYINIKAIEDVNINCKNANVIADDVVTVNCKNSNIVATEDIAVNCNNITAMVTETATITSKNIVIQNTELVTLNSKNITIENSEIITVNSKDLIITALENVNINSKTATLTTTENVNVNCVDAVITATNEIKTTSIKFIQTGDMSISGKLEVGDGITNTGDINNNGDIKNFGNITNSGGQISSGVVILDTHKHGYEAPVVGSSPTAAIPAITGGAI
jgi:hypothetical protein